MGIFLKEGAWPEKENEILLEEYLAYRFGIASYPQSIVLQRDGQEKEYTVCGMIGNYSSNLSVSYRDVNGKKNYPSIITANYEEGNPVSLLVLQKRLEMGTASEDIYEVMSLYEKYEIPFDQICFNKYLNEGYSNTEDFEKVSLLYTMAVLFLLLLVEAVIFRAFFFEKPSGKTQHGGAGTAKKRDYFCICMAVWKAVFGCSGFTFDFGDSVGENRRVCYGIRRTFGKAGMLCFVTGGCRLSGLRRVYGWYHACFWHVGYGSLCLRTFLCRLGTE